MEKNGIPSSNLIITLRVHLIRENFHQGVEIFGAFRGIWDFLPEMAQNNPKDHKKPKINHFSEKKFSKKNFEKKILARGDPY